ncbi:TonB-dependent receptor plug domain-containing protein, partial [Poseidonibacter sp.]|uniref:TonB-dependent receptor plug domain-containing protein n=1 Tax=Poseidonibacter sp. TaxID=2321188 RepID=UPI003C72290B
MKGKLLIPLSICSCLAINMMAESTSLEEVTVVTAAGFEQNIADAPASISVLTAKELEKKAYSTVLDAVKNVPGIFVNGG